MFNSRLINTKVAGGGGGCTDIVDNYDPFGGNGVALYQLNGDATDVSTNYPATSTTGITWGTSGVFGTSASYNGSTSKIRLPSSLATAMGSNDFSISTWVYLDTMPSTFYSLATLQDVWYYYIFIASDGSVRTYNQNVEVNSAAGVVTTGQWYHIVATLSSTSGKNVYLNGANVASSSNTSNCNAFTNGHTALGYYQSGATSLYFLDGKIDQTRFINTALTPLEIEALYTEELCICDGTVDTLDILGDGSCIATYQLDGNANDLSGNYSGTPTDVSYGVGEFDLAGVFNGSSSGIITPVYNRPGNTAWSFSAWVKMPSNITGTLGAFFDGTVAYDQHLIFAIYQGRLQFGQYGSVGYGENLLPTDQWFHIVYTRNTDNSVAGFVNGSQITLKSDSTGGGSVVTSFATLNLKNEPFYIGRHQPGAYFTGSIDQVRIFNKALSAGEVTTLYNETACTVVSKSPGTLADYDFFSDNSGRGWSFDNTKASLQDAGATMVSASNTYGTGKFGQALYLNGNQTAGLSSDTYKTIFDVGVSDPYTVSVWFNATQGSKRGIIWYADGLGDTSIEFYTVDYKIYFGSGANVFVTPSTYALNTWIHAACTWTGNSINCYVNGQLIGSAASRPASGTSTCLGHPAVGLTGYVDQFRYFRRALTDEEVFSVYNETN